MIDIDALDALEALAKAATAGPWLEDEDGEGLWATGDETGDIPVIRDDGSASEEDFAFIVAANPAAVLDLVAEVRRLRQIAEAETAASLHELNRMDASAYFAARDQRGQLQAAYDAVTAALADVEVPIRLDKGQPCLDRIAALKADRDQARVAAEAHWADLQRAGRAAMQGEDEYPLQAVLRAISEKQDIEDALGGEMAERYKAETERDALRDRFAAIRASADALAVALRELKERRNNWAASLAQLQAKGGDQGGDFVTASYERTIAEVDEAIAAVKKLKEGV